MSTSVADENDTAARQRILLAAAHLMTQNGVAETRLKDVQAGANVSSSQIYHYFGDKNGLVRAVLEHLKDSILDLQTTMLSSVSTIEDLRMWADDVVAQQARLGYRGGCPIGSLSYELARTDDDVAVVVALAFRQWRTALERGLASLVAAGALPADYDVPAVATTLLTVVQGGLLLGQAQESGEALETALATVIGFIESSTTTPASDVSS